MRMWKVIPVAALLICLLAGCAAGLLGLIIHGLELGALYARVSDLFDTNHPSTDFTLYFDGYDTGVHPHDGVLDLSDLPAGDHLLAVSSTDMTVGFHKHVLIPVNGTATLTNINRVEGATISGRVLQRVGSTDMPLAGVRVAAILGGSAVIAPAGRTIAIPQRNDSDTLMMGFTDGQGNYKLGPAQFGSWVVTSAYPGLYADAVVTQVSSGHNAGNVDLTLKPDAAAAPPGTVQGTVAKSGGGSWSVPAPLVALDLSSAFTPTMDPERLTALQSEFGNLLAQPWFAWSSLATTASTSGAYVLAGPPGTHSLYGFKYNYTPVAANVTLTSGSVVNGNFTLQSR